MPYSLESEVCLPNQATVMEIRYPIDRYSKLRFVSRRYAAQTPVTPQRSL